jgi:hypothetical protein
MRYVIIRDDDTNAFTPPECLELLYRPFLERGLPVNLAVIPDVALDAKMANGRPEGFLVKRPGAAPRSGISIHEQTSSMGAPTAIMVDAAETATRAIGTNPQLVRYLQENPGYKVVHHGCHHSYHEFDVQDRRRVARLLERGAALLAEAGFSRPETFVAPYDRLSRAAMAEVQARFRILSTGWFELRRLPLPWWPAYAFKKLRGSSHWRVGKTILLSHPGCLLSCHRTYSTMMGGILHHLKAHQLTVLVTHWWEYFRDDRPDEPFIEFLHETANHLATSPDIRVIAFADLLSGAIALE